MGKIIRIESDSLTKKNDETVSFNEKIIVETTKDIDYSLEELRNKMSFIDNGIVSTQLERTKKNLEFDNTISTLNAKKDFYQGTMTIRHARDRSIS